MRHGSYFVEHGFAVDPDNSDGSRDKKEGVVGLSVGPDGVVELKVEQHGQQNAPPRCVK